MSFWGELRRRNVVKVGAAYLVMAWLIVQIATSVLPTFSAPDWVAQSITFILMLLFPVALIIAWAYEITPEGIKKTEQVPVEESIARVTGQRLNYVVTVLLSVSVVFMVLDNYVLDQSGDSLASDTASVGAGASSSASNTPTEDSIQETGASETAGTDAQRLPNSVAVLPFTNMSPDPDNAYFAAGIHEEILNYLARLNSLNVIARTSMLQYTDTTMPIPEIAAELNVETVMEGSVRYAGDRVRVTTQLIDAATGAHLWSDAYEQDLSDIFAIQADIAMNVANALNAEFSAEEQLSIETAPTTSSEAYVLYLQVLNLIGAGDQSSQILLLLDRALERDPDFALAHSTKAWVYAQLLINTSAGSAGNWADIEALARAHAERARTLDPSMSGRGSRGGGDSALANIEMFAWRWPEARVIYENYYESTGHPLAYFNWFNAWVGDTRRGIEIATRSAELNPIDWSAHWTTGISYLYAGDPDGAVPRFQQGILLAPTLPLQHSFLAMAEIARGNYGDAQELLEQAEQLTGTNRNLILLLDIAYGYGRIGLRDQAERLYREIEMLAAVQEIGTGGWTLASLAIGDQEAALEQLRLAADRASNKVPDPGFFSLMNIRMNYTQDPVLEQTEFADLRRRLSGD